MLEFKIGQEVWTYHLDINGCKAYKCTVTDLHLIGVFTGGGIILFEKAFESKEKALEHARARVKLLLDSIS